MYYNCQLPTYIKYEFLFLNTYFIKCPFIERLLNERIVMACEVVYLLIINGEEMNEELDSQ